MSSYLAEYLEHCFYVYFLLILLSDRNHLNKLVSHLVVSDKKKTLFVHTEYYYQPKSKEILLYLTIYMQTKRRNSSQTIKSQNN